MTDEQIARLIAVLEEIRDHQRIHLERQAEALALQREQLAPVNKHQERAEKLQARA